jgi:hypothetical protein
MKNVQFEEGEVQSRITLRQTSRSSDVIKINLRLCPVTGLDINGSEPPISS